MANPNKYCYIIILPEDDSQNATGPNAPIKIPFDTMPATITDAKQAVWQDTAIIARSAPLKTYQFSGARTITFSLDFFVSIEKGDVAEGGEGNALFNMKTKLNQLRGLTYPSGGANMKRPRKVIVRIGDAFGMFAFCKQVSIVYRGDSPWELDPMMAHHATVNIMLEETGEKLYTFDDIMMDQDFSDLGPLTAASVTVEAQTGPVTDSDVPQR